MCVVSMVMDHYTDRWQRQYERGEELPYYPQPPRVSQEELDEFRKLLERAREYDRKHNEPDCELDEKRKRVKELADKLGVKVDFI